MACKHCTVYQLKNPTIKTYGQIGAELEHSYRLGSRFVDFEGGEPTLWRDNDKDLNSLIRLAKKTGYYSTTITTNAQLPFTGSEADSIWVSLDGTGEFHDAIRGKGARLRPLRFRDGGRNVCGDAPEAGHNPGRDETANVNDKKTYNK